MRPVEMGSMIVSTPVLVCCKINDLIRASPALLTLVRQESMRAGARVEPLYSRHIGCDKWYTALRHTWDEFRGFNLDKW